MKHTVNPGYRFIGIYIAYHRDSSIQFLIDAVFLKPLPAVPGLRILLASPLLIRICPSTKVVLIAGPSL